jgi:dUTP pyrophosphatase
MSTHYVLKMFIDSDDANLINLYKEAMQKHNAVVERYFEHMSASQHVGISASQHVGISASQHVGISASQHVCVDAGFDLFCPEKLLMPGLQTGKVNHKVKTAMEFVANATNANTLPGSTSYANTLPANTLPVGYYLYPRSSTGSKTPLRMANSIGIIDAGYRGDLIAVFDNWQNTAFEIEPYQRLAQICPPNLTYPMYVQLVQTEAGLGVTDRGARGFGSSGK